VQTFTETLKAWLPSLSLAALVILFVAHFSVVATHAVNVPFWDEWTFFERSKPEAFPDKFSSAWLLPQMNEHRLVPTKLLLWTLLRLNGWNAVTNQLINFLLYGLIIVSLMMFAARMVPSVPTWTTAAFLIFLLSPTNYANHFWAVQSVVHFSLLFFLLAVYFLFDERQRNSSLLLGAVMAILATYSFLSGLIAVSVLILLFGVFKAIRILQSSGAEGRRKDLVQLAMVVLPVGAAIGLYFFGYDKGKSQALLFPNTRLFWSYLLDLYSWAFGFSTSSFLLGLICFLLVVTPIVGELWRSGRRLPSSTWAVLSFSLGIMAIMLAFTGGRAGDDSLRSAKISRYAEVVMMLVPVTVFAWSIFLRNRPVLRKYLLIGLWSLCFLGYANDWLWFRVYGSMARERREGVNCIKNYYEHGGEGKCPTIYPRPIAEMLERAKQVNASFYREIKSGGS
jgi:hypothetical protein